MLYLWRKGALIASTQCSRGKVDCLVVNGDRVYCGGSGAVLKVVDARTLNTIVSFPLVGASLTASAPSGRPRSASAGAANKLARPSSAAASRSREQPKSHAAGVATKGPPPGPSAESDGSNSNSGSKTITGIAIVVTAGRGAAQSCYAIVSLGTGKCVRVDIGSPLPSSSSSSSSAAAAASGESRAVGKDLFHFHTGAMYGLAADVTSSRRLIATVCDDRKLMVWDAQDCVLIGKALTQVIILIHVV